MSKIPIPPIYEEKMRAMFEYASHLDRWIDVKVELIKSLPWQYRSAFSRRDARTKRTWTNAFELYLADRWSKMTGRPVLFKDDEGPRTQEPPTDLT